MDGRLNLGEPTAEGGSRATNEDAPVGFTTRVRARDSAGRTNYEIAWRDEPAGGYHGEGRMWSANLKDDRRGADTPS
jgi:hypothetical protein